MPYRHTFDLTVLPKRFFRELMIVVNSRRLHKRAGRTLRALIEKFRISEITGLEISDILQVVEDIVDIYIKNIVYAERFRRSVKRALFLPHCARKYADHRCRADFYSDVPTYACRECSADCQINIASRLAKEMGYDVYIIPGSSCIPKILSRFGYDGVVGVACGDEIKLATKYLGEDVAGQAIPLLRNGCSNTTFNLDHLARILKSYREHSVGGGQVDFRE